jgi:hypothetical protein
VKGNICCKVNIALALSGVASNNLCIPVFVHMLVSKNMSRVFRKCMTISGGVWACKFKFPMV